MRKSFNLVVCFTLLFLGLSAKDTVKVGLAYPSDTNATYYHPRFQALNWGDTVVFHNQSGIHTTAGKNTPGFFPTFSTTPLNPYFQFSLNQGGTYNYFDQNQGQQINGVLFQNPAGLSCDVSFSYAIDSTDSTHATYTFTPTSQSGLIAQAFWDYQDGSIDSNGVSQTHTFGQSGLYEVSLTVRLSNGCYASFSQIIPVFIIDPNGCEANFTTIQQSPTSMNFYSSSVSVSNAISHTWYQGQSGAVFSTQVNPTYTFPDTGWYEVCLVLEDSLIQCVDTVCRQVYLAPPPPCFAQTSYVQNQTQPLNYQLSANAQHASNALPYWFVDGQLVSNQWSFNHDFFSAGVYQIELIVTDSAYCYYQQTDSLQVQSSTGSCSSSFIYAIDSIDGRLSVDGAAGGTAPFSFSWDFGSNANPQYASGINVDSVYFNTSGYQLVTLNTTDAQGCVSVVKDSIFVPAPTGCVADFTFLDDSTLTVQFFSNVPHHNLLSYHWDFGDSSTSTQVNPTHTYKSAGYYGVKLSIFDSLYNCSDVFIDSIYFYDRYCEHDLEITQKQPYTYSLKASTQGGIFPFTHTWYIPGASPDTAFGSYISQVTFPQKGNYQVCLVTTDALGCSVQTCDSIYVAGSTVDANFIMHQYAPNYRFFEEAVSSSDSIVSYFWDFGDGNTSTQANPSHVYQSKGTFQVCLTATDVYGFSDQYCRFTTVDSVWSFFCNPNLSLSIDSTGLITAIARLQGLSTAAQYSISLSGYATYFNQDTVYYNVAGAGSYQVSLSVTDSIANCTTTVSDTVNYAGNATCYGGFTVVKVGDPYQYFFSPYVIGVPASNVDSFLYDFGDGSTPIWKPGFLFNPTGRTFSGPGNYQVCLTVVGKNNCIFTYCDSLEVLPDTCLTGFWAAPDQINQLQYYFADQSKGAKPIIKKWFFGDGDSSNLNNPVHIYAAPGVYPIELHTIDALGCTGVKHDTITVVSGPTPCSVDFVFQSTGQSGMNFTSFVTGAGGTTYSWDFGDGSTSTSGSPSHNYSQPGNFLVCLEITDQVGCKDKVCKWVSIYGGNCDASFAAIPDSTNGMMDYMFRPYYASPRGDSKYTWLIDSIDTISHIMFANYSFNTVGWHQVCLYVQDTVFGVPCVDSVCRDVYADTVFFAHVPEFKTHAAGFRTIIFDNNTVSLDWFRPQSSGLSYLWEFGDGSTTSLQNPIHIYADTGLFEVCLTVEETSTGKFRRRCDSVMVRNGLGLAENSFDELLVFPNPTAGEVQLSWLQNTEEQIVLQVYNLMGSLILEENIHAMPGEQRKTLDLKALPDGMYQISLSNPDNNRKLVTRLVKQ